MLVGVMTAWLMVPGGQPRPVVFQAVLAAGLGLGLVAGTRPRPSPTEWALGAGLLCVVATWFRWGRTTATGVDPAGEPSVTEAELLIRNQLGLHARACALFVKTAARFASEVYVSRDDLEVNGKSIMGVMMLAAEEGSTIRVRVDGPRRARGAGGPA